LLIELTITSLSCDPEEVYPEVGSLSEEEHSVCVIMFTKYELSNS